MKHINGTKEFFLPPTVVVLGNFDGIHKGHRELINIARAYSKDFNLKSLVFTFNPHPTFLLENKKAVNLIYLSNEKKKILQDLVDIFIEYPFDIETLKMSPEFFVDQIISKQLNAKVVVVGDDYRFGQNRKGDIHLLNELSNKYGYKLIVLNKIKYENTIISSTWIRKEILDGNMEKVTSLLGQPFCIFGEVEYGKNIGNKLGFPTANITPSSEKITPPNGVYISRVTLNNQLYESITNIGVNPTVNGQKKVIETYIFDFNGNIYGEEIKIEILKYIRNENKFESVEGLKQQINNDIMTAKKYFNDSTEKFGS